MPIVVQFFIMLSAAALEVLGDALIRRGMAGGGKLVIVIGFVVLGSYGIMVNRLGCDFSKMLGAYVGWFTLVSILVGWLLFRERIAPTTWVGLAIILVGSLVIQSGALKTDKVNQDPSSRATHV